MNQPHDGEHIARIPARSISDHAGSGTVELGKDQFRSLTSHVDLLQLILLGNDIRNRLALYLLDQHRARDEHAV